MSQACVFTLLTLKSAAGLRQDYDYRWVFQEALFWGLAQWDPVAGKPHSAVLINIVLARHNFYVLFQTFIGC